MRRAGMGLTPRQILWRVELPLALPSIFAGLRIATVTTVSLATVAAFLIDEGLGSPIHTAINNEIFKTELYRSRGARRRAGDRLRPRAAGRAADAHAVDAQGGDVNDFVNAFPFIGHHSGLLLTLAWHQLEISAEAMAISMAIALPLGIWLGHIHRGSVRWRSTSPTSAARCRAWR